MRQKKSGGNHREKKSKISKFSFFNFFDDFFLHIFSRKDCSFFLRRFLLSQNIFLHGVFSISMQNFPRNPKIVLRKPCGHVWSMHILKISKKPGKKLFFPGFRVFEGFLVHGWLQTVRYQGHFDVFQQNILQKSLSFLW